MESQVGDLHVGYESFEPRIRNERGRCARLMEEILKPFYLCERYNLFCSCPKEQRIQGIFNDLLVSLNFFTAGNFEALCICPLPSFRSTLLDTRSSCGQL